MDSLPSFAAIMREKQVLRLGLQSSAAFLLLFAASASRATPREQMFDDPLFRRCIAWMLDGTQGALIENLCIDDFAIPPPSIFLCARKAMTGFQSAADQEGCALVFEDQARKARSGFVK